MNINKGNEELKQNNCIYHVSHNSSDVILPLVILILLQYHSHDLLIYGMSLWPLLSGDCWHGKIGKRVIYGN